MAGIGCTEENISKKMKDSSTLSTRVVSIGRISLLSWKGWKGQILWEKRRKSEEELHFTAITTPLSFILLFPIVNPLKSDNGLCNDVHFYLSFLKLSMS